MAARFQHLRAFHAIACEGGVTRAARRLNVSQPTLSQQLKALEARHGVSLFEGRSTPLQLTTAGRDLFALTQRLFAMASDIDDMLGETSSLTGGLLRLGADSPQYAARVVTLFHQRHPQIGVQVRTGNARDVMRWLSEAQIDAALASDPPADAAFSYDLLFTDDLTCALPLGHRLTRLAAVPVAALAEETLLLREPTSRTRTFTERALAEAGVTPTAILELHGRETIREAIALGLGISVFFSSECPPDRRIDYRPFVAGPSDRLNGFLLCRSERRRTSLMRALQTVVRGVREADAAASEPAPAMITLTLAGIVELYAARGGECYGEDVTQCEHAVQSAVVATAHDAPPTLVAAALLHDIGHLLAGNDDDEHGTSGAAALAPLFGPAVCGPIALHVAAKRYLCATEPDYQPALSRASQRSLERQGGPFDAAAATRFVMLPHAAAAILLRRCDDGGKRDEASDATFADFVLLLTALANRGGAG